MGRGNAPVTDGDWRRAEFVVSAVKPEQYPQHALPEIAMVGRSNVGKSSLINAVLGRRNLARTGSQPGRTRTLNFYRVADAFFLVDLPGYGYAKVSMAERERWGAMIERYLERRPHLAGVLHIVDSRHPATENDRLMAAWLRDRGLPAVVVATKIDKVPRGHRKGKTDTLTRDLGLPVTAFSAEKGDGRPQVIEVIQGMLLDAQLRERAPQ